MGKEEIKLSLFANDMILYMENPKDSTKNKKNKKPKLLELKDEFSKVAGYKINIQKSVTLLYINNDQKGKLRKQFCLQLLQKIFRNKFNKGVQDFYTKNYKTLLKEIKEDKINGKASYSHG